MPLPNETKGNGLRIVTGGSPAPHCSDKDVFQLAKALENLGRVMFKDWQTWNVGWNIRSAQILTGPQA